MTPSRNTPIEEHVMLKLIPSRLGRNRALGVAVAMALGAATIALSPAAQAATSPGLTGNTTPHAVTALAGTVKASGTASGRSFTLVRPNQSVSCTIYTDNPFTYSGEPYGQGVEGIAYVDCTGTVYAIEVEAEIYYDNDGDYWLSGYRTEYDTLYAANNADAPLSEGYWQTCGGAYVWWTSTSDTFISACGSETFIS
jgi:hypothetical protein